MGADEIIKDTIPLPTSLPTAIQVDFNYIINQIIFYAAIFTLLLGCIYLSIFLVKRILRLINTKN